MSQTIFVDINESNAFKRDLDGMKNVADYSEHFCDTS